MRLLGTRELLLLCPLFVYAGLAYPLNLSVLGTSFGHTEALGDAKTVLVGAASVVFGKSTSSAHVRLGDSARELLRYRSNLKAEVTRASSEEPN